MAKHRSNPASRRAKNALAKRVQKIQYQNRIAVITQDEIGRIKIYAQEQEPLGASIRSNLSVIMEQAKFLPPYMTKEDADYLRQQCQPLVTDPDRLRSVY